MNKLSAVISSQKPYLQQNYLNTKKTVLCLIFFNLKLCIFSDYTIELDIFWTEFLAQMTEYRIFYNVMF